jgi:AraC-like DNA-binding protein
MKHYHTAHTHLSGDRVASTFRISLSGYRTEPHEHDEYMFLLPRSGLLILNVESIGAPLRIAPMSFVAVPPQLVHDTQGNRAAQEHIAVYVARDFVASCEHKAKRSLIREKLTIWPAPWSLMSAIRLASLERSGGTMPDVGKGELADYRSDLMDRLVATACIEAGLAARPLPISAADARRELVEDIKAFLDATLAQRLDINRIAYEFGMSRRTLTRTFREQTGKSVVEYQSLRRVQYAATLLQSPGTTVAAAAAIVGVDSPSYLARLFARYGPALPGTLKR